MTKPNINLHLGDCLEAMKGMQDNQFDLAIVDPPYGINAANMQMGSNPNRSRNDGHGSGPGISTAVKLNKGRLNQGCGKLKNMDLNTMNCDWDFEIPSKEYFDHIFRVSKNQVIWGGNYFDLPPTRGIIAWNKKQSWDNFSQFELAWTSFDMPAMVIELSNTGGANSEEKIHPTQKPSILYKQTIARLAKRNLLTADYKILDTHAGSFSIGIACHDMGFYLDAYEIDEDYYNAAMKRFNNHIQQGSLFEPQELNNSFQKSIEWKH